MVDSNNRTRLAIQAADDAVVLRAQLGAGDVFHTNSPAIWCFAQDNVVEFLWCPQTALSQHGIGELLVLRRRLTSNLTGWVDSVLSLDRVDNVCDGNAELCQLVRPYPEPHGILSRAEDRGLTDAVQAPDRIIQVDVSIVCEIGSVVGAFRRIQGDQHERSGGRLREGHTIAVHLGRQLPICQLLTRLRENQIHIGIRVEFEIHKQRRLLVGGGAHRVHVRHVVHAADLLLDRRGHSLLERLRICTNKCGSQPDLGWGDLWKLRHR